MELLKNLHILYMKQANAELQYNISFVPNQCHLELYRNVPKQQQNHNLCASPKRGRTCLGICVHASSKTIIKEFQYTFIAGLCLS